MSKTSKVKNALLSGTELTAKQISGYYGLKNPHDAIYQLRNQGVCIYSNSSKLADGTRTTKYRVGTPSKRMVALTRIVGGSAFFKR